MSGGGGKCPITSVDGRPPRLSSRRWPACSQPLPDGEPPAPATAPADPQVLPTDGKGTILGIGAPQQ